MSVNIAQHDTIEDYVLMNAPRSAKEKPICQTLCSLLVIVFAIASMAVNEISDGDIDVEFTSEEEDIDFDCGWNGVLFTFAEIDESSDNHVHTLEIDDAYKSYLTDITNNNYVSQIINNLYYSKNSKNSKNTKNTKNSKNSNQNSRQLLQGGGGGHGNNNNGPLQPNEDGTETLSYSNNELCDELDDFDSDWCNEMSTAGILWLVCGILTVISSFIAIVTIWKVKHKGSKCYLFWQLFGILCMLIGVFYWIFNGRCDEFEDVDAPEEVSMQVSLGSSMTLMFVALGFGIMATLISCFYICKRNQAELNFDYTFELRQKAGLTEDNNTANNNNANIAAPSAPIGGNIPDNDDIDDHDPNQIKLATIGGGNKTKGQFESVPDDERD